MCAEPPTIEADDVLRMNVRQRSGVIVEAVRLLDQAGVGVDDIAVRRPTLDDVFLALTGHAAEIEEPADEPTRAQEAAA
jgi:ABC-2 type transport system ATP-binding protein